MKILKYMKVALALVLVLGFTAVKPAEAATIKLNKTSVTLAAKETYQLKVSGTKKKVTWKTSKKSVATVSSKGKVTAKATGSATISAKVSGKTLKCKIKVVEPELSRDFLILNQGSTYSLKLNNAHNTVTWSTKDSTIAKVSKSGVVTASTSNQGSTTVTATYYGKKYTCNVKVTNYKESYEAINTEINKSKYSDDAGYRCLYRKSTVELPTTSSGAYATISYMEDQDLYRFASGGNGVDLDDDSVSLNYSVEMYMNLLNDSTVSFKVQYNDEWIEGTFDGTKFGSSITYNIIDKSDSFDAMMEELENDEQTFCDAYLNLSAILWTATLYQEGNLKLQLGDLGMVEYNLIDYSELDI